ncbi:hypothetical protein PTTG_04647 [Puccinia triticina 1-1 BBBD Race 1]|uniref:TNT domain-containing protein n=2 Tax=Puccinia triticina TaxID=208348 RepID=A0A180GC44_PUCT1|nr:uncharacterized protein PtA15_6A872 [Puccinia triticina]OAV90255.1 hypothetical protein PTTG_04647 [Puccinia triticina 1-1 BBBD Race 1]WAQ86240.1 hypothetical protein PtA15_6A872 [Puccinia triticina]
MKNFILLPWLFDIVLTQLSDVAPLQRIHGKSGAAGVTRSDQVQAPGPQAGQCRNPCTSQSHPNSAAYVCGDPRLGPAQLPTHAPLNSVTASYDRFGGVCPETFLKRWTAHGSYEFPPNDGFLANIHNVAIFGNVSLEVGRKIDRFGSEFGTIAHPARAPYAERSLPPSNLNTPADQNGKAGKHPFNYHLYEVKKRIPVLAGPIAPWFGQPGMGTQFKFSQNIIDYVNQGYLKRIQP